jgi:hypothetical protein
MKRLCEVDGCGFMELELIMGQATCELCGEPMPPGEEMFKIHGYSGPCPKPPKPRKRPAWIDAAAKECGDRVLVGEGERAFAEIIERHAAAAGKA